MPHGRALVEHLLQRDVRHRRHQLEQRRAPPSRIGATTAARAPRPIQSRRRAARSPGAKWYCSGTNGAGGALRPMRGSPVASCGSVSMKSRAKRSASRPAVEAEEEQPEVDQRADRVERELERRDDAEVAAAAAQRPEQIGVLVRRGAHDARRRRSRPRRRPGCRTLSPALLGEPADAAAERQPADAGVADEAAGRRPARAAWVAASTSAQVAPPPHTRTPRRGIDGDAVHRAEIDHQAAVADRVAGVVVAAAATRSSARSRARADRVRDVLRRAAARDHRGLAVDVAVPHHRNRS